MLNKRQRNNFCIFVVICLLSIGLFNADANTNSINGKFFKNAPVIDGKIGADEWMQADKVQLVPDSDGKANDKSKITAWIGYDENGLYLAVDCPQNYEPRSSGDDDTITMLQNSDTIEFFLRPGQKTNQYLHLAVNPAGAKYDAMGFDNTHNVYWQSHTIRTKEGWQVEVFIPFAGMGFADPLEKVWTVQIAVNQKSAGTQRLSRWPGGKGSFHTTKNFGKFGPLQVAFERFGDSLKMQQLKPLIIGENPILLQVRNNNGRARSVRLTTSIKDSQGSKFRVIQQALPEGKTCSLESSLKVETLMPVEVQAELLDAAGKVLFCSPLQILKPARAKLEIVFTSPAYRDTIYSSNPLAHIRFNVLAAFDKATLTGKTVKAEFMQTGLQKKSICSQTAPAESVMNFTLDKMGDLPLGDYAVTVLLVDEKGKVCASAEKLLRKLPPVDKGNEVVFDDNHRMMVNGKFFFPLGAFMDNPGNPMQSCSKAWNVIMPSGYGVKSPTSRWFEIYKQQLDLVQRTGRKFVLQMNGLIRQWDNPQVRYACHMAVEQLRGHPALLAWCIDEEANLHASGDLAAYQANYKRIVEDFRQWDPYHPVIGVVSPNGGRGMPDFEVYGPLSDVAAADIYPIPYPRTGETIGKVAEGMKAMVAAVDNRSPVFFVPQIAGWQHYREPTEAEMQCMMFGSIVTGARGLLAFAVQYPMWTQRDGDKDMYLTKVGIDAANRVADYIASQADIFNGIDYPVSCDAKDVYAVIKETPKGTFLLAVNMSYEIKQFKMTSDKLKEYNKAIYNSREFLIRDGEVKDAIKHLGCRIYKLQKY